MDMPPSRYKVVERGRRLIVIDRLNGVPVSGLPPEQRERLQRLESRLRENSPPRPALARPSAAPGLDAIMTQRWYDDKAPRRVRMTDKHRSGSAAVLAVTAIVGVFALIWLGWFLVPIAAVLLFQPGVRKSIRKAITVWIDSMEQA